MSELRGIRLLNAVENGSVLGAELESFLSDSGRLAEFTVLLSQRGQAQRIANGQTTMSAIVLSMRANKAIFLQATESNSTAVEAVVKSAIAISTVSKNVDALVGVSDNPTSWKFFIKSNYYESNIKSIIANYAGINPELYPTVSSLILDPVSMGDISVNHRAMRAVVASLPTITVMASDSVAMALVAADTVAIGTIASTTSVMPTIANSSAAMNEIVSRNIATNIMASNVGSIQAIANNTVAWLNYRSGSFFTANLKTIIANLVGISPLNYADINAIIADAAALTAVASNKQAVQALMASSSAMNTLAISPNIGSVLSSPTAMSLIGPNTSAMSSFLSASGAWAGLFASSVAKGYIVASTTLVDIIAANSALITYLGTLSANATASGIPDGVVGAYQPFAGVPAKVLILSAKEVGIAATFSPYKFGGSLMAGANAGALLSLTSVANLPHVAGYTGLTWDLQGIGVTAATLPIIKYVDMT